MADSETRTIDALRFARELIEQLHEDDIAERWWARTLDPPDGVRIGFDTMGANPERVRRFVVAGDFRVEALRSAAESERYVDQADVWDLTFGPIGDVPERCASVDTCDQSGAIDRFIISPDVRRTSSRQQVAPSSPPPSARTPPTGPPSDHGGGTDSVTIGELVPVERFDDSDMLASHIVTQLDVLRSGPHDIEDLLLLRPVDDATAMFGAPPGFLPVLGTMVDGGTLGHMLDAEELGQIDPRLLLYVLTMDGAMPADNRFVLPTVLRRAVRTRHAHGEEPAEVAALVADLGITLQPGEGQLEFGYGVKRKQPQLSITGWRWRNDASGNGVLAARAHWGTASIRKPTSTERAIDMAVKLAADAPAAALYCAQEAMIFGNRVNDVVVVKAAYAAMVGPLRSLDRPRTARRAAALAEV